MDGENQDPALATLPEGEQPVVEGDAPPVEVVELIPEEIL